MRVADLHCDLLWYLSNDPARTVNDLESQCSIPLLKQGQVAIQTFPIYTVTGPQSVERGQKQFDIFDSLCANTTELQHQLAIENASGFCSEQEPLAEGLRRAAGWNKKHPLVYISLTWNEENRFGGGAETQMGLKEDGKKLLEWMSGKKIAVDLSHASDQLAQDVLLEIESLDIIPIASHSNFRSVCAHVRNLPDDIAVRIAQKKGVIGLNMVRHFVGKKPEDLILHIEHAKKLGIENHLCLGTDFFGEVDVELAKSHMKPYFFEGFSTSSCYPQIQQILKKNYSEDVIEELMYKRLHQFLENR